jgi:hypothetical protein
MGLTAYRLYSFREAKNWKRRVTMSEEKIVLIATHAGEDPERATFPLLVANAAQSMDVEAVVVLQGIGVLPTAWDPGSSGDRS